jgi:ParB-like chromosome segregation protein Spo0J
MTDDEAREIALIDNLQREDMPALEEADAYEALRQQLGTAEAIAARVGKPIEYVAKRLRLVTLGENSRRALAERLITIDHALLLARLGLEDEEKNLKWALDVNAGIKTTVAELVKYCIKRRDEHPDSRYGAWEPQSVAKLKNHIEQHAGRALARAPWDLDDATLLPAVGACNGCPQNTAANNSLFGDLNIEDATCADGICFESKRAAFVHIKLAEAYDEAFPPVKLSWKLSEAEPRIDKESGIVDDSKTLRYGQWLDVKKGSCSYVRTGVTVDWDEPRMFGSGNSKRKPGQVLLICIAKGCKVHEKAYEKKGGRVSSNANDSVNRAKREAAEKEYLESETPIREAIYDALIRSGKVTHDGIFRKLVLWFCSDGDISFEAIARRRNITLKNDWDSKPLTDAISQASKAELDGWAFDLLVVPKLQPNDYMYSPADRKRDREELWKLAREFGVDPDAAAAKVVLATDAKVPAKKAAKKTAAKKAAAKPAKKAAAKKKAAKP